MSKTSIISSLSFDEKPWLPVCSLGNFNSKVRKYTHQNTIDANKIISFTFSSANLNLLFLVGRFLISYKVLPES